MKANICKGAILELIKMGGIAAKEGAYERRIEICKNCPSKQNEGEGTEIKCKECGCCMDAKTRFDYHILEGFTKIKCPLGHWE